MNTKDYILNILQRYNIPASILLRYEEPHRFYHNMDHIIAMMDKGFNGIMTNDLALAIIFHDIIYDPRANDNEEKSAELLKVYFDSPEAYQAILDTKHHDNPQSELSEILINLDLDIIHNSSFTDFCKYDEKIFKEYQHVSLNTYRQKRIEILTELKASSQRINYVKNRIYNIALYPGSFNPFHKGHMNILEKAERIFDKVIISIGVNKSKIQHAIGFPVELINRQLETYDTLLTDYVDSIGHDVTVIRGIRNSTDLQYELNQYRYMQEMKPDIKVVSIFCDSQFEHISSSAIRELENYGTAIASPYKL